MVCEVVGNSLRGDIDGAPTSPGMRGIPAIDTERAEEDEDKSEKWGESAYEEACVDCVSFTRSGLRVRNVFIGIAPARAISRQNTFEHPVHKRGIRSP